MKGRRTIEVDMSLVGRQGGGYRERGKGAKIAHTSKVIGRIKCDILHEALENLGF